MDEIKKRFLGTRLALIRYDPWVAAGLVIMSLVRLFLLYSKVQFRTFVIYVHPK